MKFAFVLAGIALVCAPVTRGQSPKPSPPMTPLGWYTPQPQYPSSAKADRIHGEQRVRATTNESGALVSAIIEKPLTPELDKNTISFALANWRGPAHSTKVITVRYILRRRP